MVSPSSSSRPIRRVLLPTDGSLGARAAFDYGLFLVEHFAAELHLFHALTREPGSTFEAQAFPSLEEIRERVEEVARSGLARWVEEAPDRLKIVQAQREAASPPDAILDYVAEAEIDLVVIGTHGRRGLRRLVLGSTTEEVLGRAPCPVISLRPESVERAGKAVHGIVVPLDFSESSLAALREASRWARELAAELHVLHAINPQIYAGPYGPISRFMDQVGERVREALHREVAALDDRVDVEIHVATQAPMPAILECIESTRSGLVVVGSQGHGALERAVVGSVTRGLARVAPVPLMVCPLVLV